MGWCGFAEGGGSEGGSVSNDDNYSFQIGLFN